MDPHRRFVRFLYLNANGIQNRIHVVYAFMLQEFVDVACICETFLKSHIQLHSHPEFAIYRHDRDDRPKGGVMIIVRRNIRHQLKSFINCKLVENINIELYAGNRKFQVSSCYLPGGASTTQVRGDFPSDIRLLTRRPSHTQFLAMGDFNSKHRFWNCNMANAAGKILYDEMNNGHFTIHHPHNHTYHPADVTRMSSTPDLLLTNTPLQLSELSTHAFGSDHNGVMFSLTLDSSLSLNPMFSRPSFKHANWKTYERVVNQQLTDEDVNINNIVNTTQIDFMIDKLTTTIKSAQEAAVPMTIPGKYALILPSQVEEKIKVRNILQKRCQRARLPSRKATLKAQVNELTHQIEKDINEIRNENWAHSVGNIPSDDNHRKLWQTTRFLKNRCRKLPVLKQSNVTAITPQEKANVLASQFAKAHQNPLATHDPSHTTTTNVAANEILLSQEQPTPTELPRTQEIQNYVKKLRNSKAPGMDKVHNTLLKHLPWSGLRYLTAVVIACMQHCYFPNCWKHANVIPIRKPGKKASDPASYRPISLLSSLSKILERAILTRINQHLEANNIIPADQCGFVQKKSTVHQLQRIKQHIKSNLNNRPSKSTGMLLIDIEKAFDRVYNAGLIVKMRNFNFPSYLVRIIGSFLADRSFSVVIDGKNSPPIQMPFGVPQGAVCSPVLYNIYTADAPNPAPCERALFADDTSYYFSSRLRGQITSALRQTMTSNEQFFCKWKIKTNLAKSQAIFFTRRRTREIPRRPLRIGNNDTPWADNFVKYLGVLLDKKLTFAPHINYTCEKVDKAIRILYPLLNRRSKLSQDNKILLYKVAIRPIMSYACPIFIDAAKTHLRKLQVKQNKILRMILNAPYDTRITTLHTMANIETIHEHFLKLTEKFSLSLIAVDDQ